MDLALHFEMDYAQILRKCPNKDKKNFAILNSVRNLVIHFYKSHKISDMFYKNT